MLNLVDFLHKTADVINKSYPEFKACVEEGEPGALKLYRVFSIKKGDESKITISYSDTVCPDDLSYLDSDEHTPENYARYIMSLISR